MSQTNNCALKKAVNSPALWPATLNKPLASVTSYVFKSQEHTQKFVKFMMEKLPGVEVKGNRDDKGFYIVNLSNLTRGCKDGVNVGNYSKDYPNEYYLFDIPCSMAASKCPGGFFISYGDFYNCKCAFEYNKKK